MIWWRVSSRSSRKIFPDSVNWEQPSRSGKTASRCWNCTAAIATRSAQSRGPMTRSFSSGRRQKGWAARVCLHVLQERRNWSGAAGRGILASLCRRRESSDITLAQLLSHQAGLVAFDESVDVLDYAAVVRALEKQTTALDPWDGARLPCAHFRISCSTNSSGESTPVRSRNIGARFLPNHSVSTSGSDCPQSRTIALRRSTRRECRVPPSPDPFFRALSQPGTIQRKAFTSPHGLHAVSAMNTPENRARAFVSFGGIGSADVARKILCDAGERRLA